MRAIQEDDRPAGFQFSPVGPFLLRDYSSDDVDDLKLLRGLLEEILTRHKMLVPGSMNRLMVQWRGDVDRGIEASTPEYGPQPGTSADPARSASPREPSPLATRHPAARRQTARAPPPRPREPRRWPAAAGSSVPRRAMEWSWKQA